MKNAEAQPNLEPNSEATEATATEATEASPTLATTEEPVSPVERLEARLEGLEARLQPLERKSFGDQFHKWTLYVIAIAVAVLGLLQDGDRRKTRRIEVDQYLAEAWDLMGGKPGTKIINIGNFAPEDELILAHRLIKKALSLEPKYPKAHYHLGTNYLGLDKLDDANEEYRHAIGRCQGSCRLKLHYAAFRNRVPPPREELGGLLTR